MSALVVAYMFNLRALIVLHLISLGSRSQVRRGCHSASHAAWPVDSHTHHLGFPFGTTHHLDFPIGTFSPFLVASYECVQYLFCTVHGMFVCGSRGVFLGP